MPTVALEAAKMIKKFRKYPTYATDQIKDSLGPGYENLKPQDLHPKNFIKKQINEAMVDQPKKLNAKVKLDPDML